MPQVINTNIASLTVQRNLNANQGAAMTAMERLSTGLRINSAKDDAAGMAISSRMTADIDGLNQAIRNAGDAISLTQTAEGALTEIADNLLRIRELAVQSSNFTNSNDRAALNTEVQQLILEIDRVAETTKFADTKLIDGNVGTMQFQVGYDAGQTVSIAGIVDANSAALGSSNANTSANLTFNKTALTSYATAVTATHFAIETVASGEVSLGAIAAASNTTERATQIVTAINDVSGQTGVSASYDSDTGEVTLASEVAFTVHGGATAEAAEVGITGLANGTDVDFNTVSTNNGFTGLNVSSFSAAQTMIKHADSALDSVNTARATLGAYQSRFESIGSNLERSAENLSASRSRILDADFAAETAAMTKAQILQQAGISVLSQANAAPQNVLALLQ